MSNIKIIKTKEGDIVNGVLYKPFWFGPHINVEDRTIKDWEKMEERNELELLEMEKERKGRKMGGILEYKFRKILYSRKI